jgi:hypothetical protein
MMGYQLREVIQMINATGPDERNFQTIVDSPVSNIIALAKHVGPLGQMARVVQAARNLYAPNIIEHIEITELPREG